MSTLITLVQNPYILVALSIWELLWKGLALWKAAKKNQKYWYVAILIINSIGALPIVYLLLDKRTTNKK